jgi:hypothetical protein
MINVRQYPSNVTLVPSTMVCFPGPGDRERPRSGVRGTMVRLDIEKGAELTTIDATEGLRIWRHRPRPRGPERMLRIWHQKGAAMATIVTCHSLGIPTPGHRYESGPCLARQLGRISSIIRLSRSGTGASVTE